MTSDIFSRFVKIYANENYVGLKDSEIMTELERLKNDDPYHPDKDIDWDSIDEYNGYKVRYRDGTKIISETVHEESDKKINIDINYQIPKRYDLPDDMKSFYRKMGKSGLKLTKLSTHNGIFKIHEHDNKLLPINEFHIWYVGLINKEFLDNYCDHDDTTATIDLNDWIKIYSDGSSVDNGAGALIINLNPESPLYGNVLSYTSCDEGDLKFVAESFGELIQFLIDVPVYPYETDELANERQCSDSVCDHMNQWCSTCWNDIDNPNIDKLVFDYNRKRKMDQSLQMNIKNGAIEMQSRPNGLLYHIAKEEFEMISKLS